MGQYFSTSKAGEAEKAEDLTRKVSASLEPPQPLFDHEKEASPSQITNLPSKQQVAASSKNKLVRRRFATAPKYSSLYAVLPSALLHTTTTVAKWSNYKKAKKLFSVDLLNTGGRIGIYLPHERKVRIAKFHAKRRKRGKVMQCDGVVSAPSIVLLDTPNDSRPSPSQPKGSLSIQETKEKQPTASSETTKKLIDLPSADLVVSSLSIQEPKEKLPSSSETAKKLIDLVKVAPQYNLCIPQGTPRTAILPSSLVSSSTTPAYWSNSKQTKKLFFTDALNTGGRIGIYPPDERKARVAKFHSKFHAKRKRGKATSYLKCASTTTTSLDDAAATNNSRSRPNGSDGETKPQTANKSTYLPFMDIVVSSETVVPHDNRCVLHVPASLSDDEQKVPCQTNLKSIALPSKDCMVSPSERCVLPPQAPKCSSLIQEGKEKLPSPSLTTEKLTDFPSTDLVVSSEAAPLILPSSLVVSSTTKETKTDLLNMNGAAIRTGIGLPEKARVSKVRAKRRTLTFKRRIRQPYRPRVVDGKSRYDGNNVVKEAA